MRRVISHGRIVCKLDAVVTKNPSALKGYDVMGTVLRSPINKLCVNELFVYLDDLATVETHFVLKCSVIYMRRIDEVIEFLLRVVIEKTYVG